MKKQPNKWTCYPTAASILTKIPIQKIIETVGHDGSEKVEDGPFSKRAFHTHEMAIALYKLGWSLTPFAAAMALKFYPTMDELSDFMELYAEKVIVCIETNYNTIHALSWFVNSNNLYDPRTGNRISWKGLRISTFEILTKNGSQRD